MALKLENMDIITIKKYGRWSSDTFLAHIHEQILALGVNMSKTMAIPYNAFNVAAIQKGTKLDIHFKEKTKQK